MHKLPIYLILVFAIMLAACNQATSGAQQVTAAPTNAVAPATSIALATKVATMAVVQNPSAAQPTNTQAVQPTDTQPANQAPTAPGNSSASTMECQVVSLSPTQGPTQTSMFPPPSKDDYVLGSNPNAELTIIEYSDFQ